MVVMRMLGAVFLARWEMGWGKWAAQCGFFWLFGSRLGAL
jgi:hypothetical protein